MDFPWPPASRGSAIHVFLVYLICSRNVFVTLKMRLFAKENQDLGKISPTFFSQSDNFDVKTEDVM